MEINKHKMLKQNLLLLVLIVVIVLIPVLLISTDDFAGTDDQAGDIIAEINSEYKPWFSPIIELPTAGLEGLLFTLQAAIGGVILGFGLGYYKGRSKGNN